MAGLTPVAVLSAALLLTGCCPVFYHQGETPDFAWYGKNMMTRAEVYDACHDRVRSEMAQLDQYYKTQLPELCLNDPEFKVLEANLMTLRPDARDESDYGKERALRDLTVTAGLDCDDVAKGKITRSNKKKAALAKLLSFSPADYPDALNGSDKRYERTPDFLCRADSRCNALLETYWRTMKTCVFDDYQLEEYVTGVSKQCVSSFVTGGAGSFKGKPSYSDYSKRPKKRSSTKY